MGLMLICIYITYHHRPHANAPLDEVRKSVAPLFIVSHVHAATIDDGAICSYGTTALPPPFFVRRRARHGPSVRVCSQRGCVDSMNGTGGWVVMRDVHLAGGNASGDHTAGYCYVM